MKSVKQIFTDIKSTIKSTYLCIRYPFLYPRNRFTDRHYTNWNLEDLLGALRSIEQDTIWYTIEHEDLNQQQSSNIFRLRCFKLANNKQYYVMPCRDTEGKAWKITGSKEIYAYIKESDILESGEIKDIYYDKNIKCIRIIISKDAEEKPFDEKTSRFITLYRNKFVSFIIGCVNVYYNVLALFHCVPTYNEWDAVEPGWNKAFGKQYLKDIKAQLKKDNCLYTWRIEQIKEKYGTFRLYCNFGSPELYNIIRKYESLSYHTCITCGKPATKLSTGWICPYCDEHAPEGSTNLN